MNTEIKTSRLLLRQFNESDYENTIQYAILKKELKHTSGRDAFINLINEADIAFIMDEIRKKLGVDKESDRLTALVKIYCYGTGQYMCDWLMASCSVPCEEVASAMEACIPEELKPYLCE